MVRWFSLVEKGSDLQKPGIIFREGPAFFRSNQSEILKQGLQRSSLEGSDVPVRIVSAEAFGTTDQRLLESLSIRDADYDVLPADALQFVEGPAVCYYGKMLKDLETRNQVEGKRFERQSIDAAGNCGTSNPPQRQVTDIDARFLVVTRKRM